LNVGERWRAGEESPFMLSVTSQTAHRERGEHMKTACCASDPDAGTLNRFCVEWSVYAHRRGYAGRNRQSYWSRRDLCQRCNRSVHCLSACPVSLDRVRLM
jgi:phage terminase small subunit